MKAVKIADLKSNLSRHLRDVRSGRALTVLDRETPIARLVPIDSGDDVVVTLPAGDAPAIGDLDLPPPIRIKVDVVKLLLADRSRRG